MQVLLQKEAAKQLKISLSALHKLVKNGDIVQIQVTKQCVRILQSDVDNFLTLQRTKAGGASA